MIICSVPPQKIRNKCNPLDPNDKNCDWSGPLENPNNGLCGACNYPQVSFFNRILLKAKTAEKNESSLRLTIGDNDVGYIVMFAT